ncbi:alpha/beta fold hydrolase [Gemella sp. GH3]|uniref:alpha/beta hydrolase n=1 Tax=unclassified Gemella TaxID=2624949 RepID=UPI0015D08089|nr:MULTISPECIES: alpha/beta fold hydrolase [unclassified Gemella]MBF0713348.1 alpha/beta fold hydrolase [Gemella sp. GH3.1]NYS50300.1 alpha/beta fold hydrolase [Gemella sp. GH3]
MKKYYKIIVASLLAILLFGSLFTGNYFYNFALNPTVDKSAVASQDSDGEVDTRLADNQKWFDNNKREYVSTSVTGDKIVGYSFVQNDTSKNNKWVIVTHGFTTDARYMSNYIKSFYDRGYNVFAPDLIAHGNSEGKAYAMGGYDSSDLVNWVKKISSEYNNPPIVLFGISMGAATTINSLNKGLPSNVVGFIEDSGYIRLKEEFTYQLDKLFGLPSFPVIPLSNLVTKVRAGYNFGDVDATEALSTTKLPVLILHGDADGFVPVDNSKEAYNLLTSDKEIHIFKEAKHCQAERKYNEEYWSYVDNFLKKVFN